MPLGFDELSKLEIAELNDNLLEKLPFKVGNLSNIKRLFIHNNRIARISVEISKLSKMKEFSSEWFIYMNPPMPKIMSESRGQIIIEQFK